MKFVPIKISVSRLESFFKGTVIQQFLYNRRQSSSIFQVTCVSTFNFFSAFRTYSWKFAHLFEIFPTIQSFLQYPWISRRIFCKRARQYNVTSKPCNKISSHVTNEWGRVQQLKIGELRLISTHGQRISIWYFRKTRAVYHEHKNQVSVMIHVWCVGTLERNFK